MQFNFAFVAGLLAATSVQAIPVKIYEETSGRGRSVTLDVQPNICKTLGPMWKNKMSSFSKPRGWACKIYDGDSCQGKGIAYNRGQDFICYLGAFDNAVNSIKCW